MERIAATHCGSCVLGINALMFVVEGSAALPAHLTSLLADALDILCSGKRVQLGILHHLCIKPSLTRPSYACAINLGLTRDSGSRLGPSRGCARAATLGASRFARRGGG
jgi:hypothetical protein